MAQRRKVLGPTDLRSHYHADLPSFVAEIPFPMQTPESQPLAAHELDALRVAGASSESGGARTGEAEGAIEAREAGSRSFDPVQTAPAIRRPTRPPTRLERLEAWASRLSIKNNFFHKIFSLIWLPFAARSGIRMYARRTRAAERFAAILPFRRFNRNFYDAMAGAALLGNSEVAAGMYLFSVCGGDYTVVCKEMKYRFLRPCLGPAIYRVVRSEDIDEKLKNGGEFNIALELEVFQQRIVKRAVPGSDASGDILVGRCDITFHCTPKSMVRDREDRRKRRHEKRTQLERAKGEGGRAEGKPADSAGDQTR